LAQDRSLVHIEVIAISSVTRLHAHCSQTNEALSYVILPNV